MFQFLLYWLKFNKFVNPNQQYIKTKTPKNENNPRHPSMTNLLQQKNGLGNLQTEKQQLRSHYQKKCLIV